MSMSGLSTDGLGMAGRNPSHPLQLHEQSRSRFTGHELRSRQNSRHNRRSPDAPRNRRETTFGQRDLLEALGPTGVCAPTLMISRKTGKHSFCHLERSEKSLGEERDFSSPCSSMTPKEMQQFRIQIANMVRMLFLRSMLLPLADSGCDRDHNRSIFPELP